MHCWWRILQAYPCKDAANEVLLLNLEHLLPLFLSPKVTLSQATLQGHDYNTRNIQVSMHQPALQHTAWFKLQPKFCSLFYRQRILTCGNAICITITVIILPQRKYNKSMLLHLLYVVVGKEPLLSSQTTFPPPWWICSAQLYSQ